MRGGFFPRPQSRESSQKLPSVTPFTLFEASCVGYRDASPIEITRQPYLMPRRIRHPRYMKDQRLMPIPESTSATAFESRGPDRFSIREFRLSPTTNIVPEFGQIEPVTANITLTTDGVRQVIHYRAPKLIELLKQGDRSYPQTKENSNSRKASTVVTLQLPRKEVDLESAISYLFKSAIAPPRLLEDDEVALLHQGGKSADLPQAPVQALPSVLNMNLFDGECAKAELAALTKRERHVKDEPPTLHVGMGFQKKGSNGRFLMDSRELGLSCGEFVLIECVDKSPIIRPLIGMSSQMDVLVDDVEADKHPFDPRIPLTRVTANGIQPFISTIPQNKFVIVLQSSVAVSACYPHASRKTDFILTCGERPRLFKLPEVTYLATSPEIKVVLPTPESRQTELEMFSQWQDQPVEELCKRRANIEGLTEMMKHGSKFKRKMPVSSELFKDVKSSEMKVLMHCYNKILRSTPWFRSKMATRARLGFAAGLAETIDEECNKRKSRTDYLMEAKRRFDARLDLIERSADEDVDFEDIDLDFEEEDENELWGQLEEPQNDDFIPFNQRQYLVRTRIDWDALGFANVPKRRLLKEIIFSMEEGEVNVQINWIRDQVEIAQRRRKSGSNR